MSDTITEEKIKKYLAITAEAIKQIDDTGFKSVKSEEAAVFYDMATRYYSDAVHFFESGNYVNAFACVNYAHGWLDGGARLGFFNVKDTKIFSID